MKSYIISHIIFLVTFVISIPAAAQDADTTRVDDKITVLPPLFEYPVAPEEISDWQKRSDWLVEHFWDNFDFKQKAVGQIQLYHAMRTYVVPMRFAAASTVMKSVDHLVGKLKKNPGLMLQFTMAAEKAIYDPLTADAIVDEVYLPFLRAVVAQKKLPEIRKVKYRHQLGALDGCLVGDRMKSFDYIDRSGTRTRFNPEAKFTLIEFGDPDCSECQVQRIKLESDNLLQQAAREGRLNIMFIIPDVDPEEGNDWKEMVNSYPHYWSVGAGSSLEETLDLRITPVMYLIGPDRNIVSKNITIERAHEIIGASASNN